ncbi:hypothetical protein LPTSP4_17880 [Leptospira ryugenii]|uniref:Uncharacterized protein n=1 Tax=Leptospira ryugenii TaxID=1917863 RepID=A0A2P2E055_9LEPT|nr:hypothetical protein LPTSP4_17880 [Leptospira ryugenii]
MREVALLGRGKEEKTDWAMTGLNCRPAACKAAALPAELIARSYDQSIGKAQIVYRLMSENKKGH